MCARGSNERFGLVSADSLDDVVRPNDGSQNLETTIYARRVGVAFSSCTYYYVPGYSRGEHYTMGSSSLGEAFRVLSLSLVFSYISHSIERLKVYVQAVVLWPAMQIDWVVNGERCAVGGRKEERERKQFSRAQSVEVDWLVDWKLCGRVYSCKRVGASLNTRQSTIYSRSSCSRAYTCISSSSVQLF